MRKFFILVAILGLLAAGSTAIAEDSEVLYKKVVDFLKQGDQFVKEQNAIGALGAYNEAQILINGLILDADNKVNKLKEQAKKDYLPKVLVYDVRAKYFESLLDGKVPGITFKIKNTGDRTLTRVEVMCYFKNKDGMVISEEDFTPVFSGSTFSSSDNKPLKANYIWRMERGKFYSAKSVPDEWKPGLVEVKVINIEFE